MLVGFAGSGKDSAAQHLVDLCYKKYSFADSLKDTLSTIFCWDRALLEGNTDESRAWRDKIDRWWAEKLDIPNFSPRYAMQYIGTEVFKGHFNKDIWVLNIEYKLSLVDQDERIVLVDGRFPNEFNVARRFKGKLLRIKRGYDPEWYETARKANFGDPAAMQYMIRSNIHSSEWAWIGHAVDAIIENNGTLAQLHKNVEKYVL